MDSKVDIGAHRSTEGPGDKGPGPASRSLPGPKPVCSRPMSSDAPVTVAIPARLASARLPRKLLARLGGKPLLQHVWERARQAAGVDQLVVVTDADELAEVVRAFGGLALPSSPDCDNGTARIASVLEDLRGELVINVQADQPLLDPGLLSRLIERWRAAPCDVLTPVYRLDDPAELEASEVVKVALDNQQRALYFSRSAIPHVRDAARERWPLEAPCWGHVGIYGYRRSALERYRELPASPLERAEKLEQLRWLTAGHRVQTFETARPGPRVDTPEQLEQLRALLERR